MEKKLFSIFLLSLMSLLAMATKQVTITKADLETGNSLTKDGVTVSAIINSGGAITGPGNFSTTLGKFTKIEISIGAISGTGWSSSGSKRIWTGSAACVSFSGMAKSSSLKIIFTIEEGYKLKYLLDKIVYKEYVLDYKSSITPETYPIKEGYTFSGWSDIPETMPAQDIVVTGTFSINKYKLTYLVDNEEYKSYDVEYGSAITPETAPTKEGYAFSGWSEIPETMPAQDVEITGYFTHKKGDANGDGKITANDIVLISQYIMGSTTDINIEAADVNGDGQVTANDIVYLSYYILHGTFPE